MLATFNNARSAMVRTRSSGLTSTLSLSSRPSAWISFTSTMIATTRRSQRIDIDVNRRYDGAMHESMYDDDLRAFRDSFKKFIDKAVKPFHEQWEKDGMVSRAVW